VAPGNERGGILRRVPTVVVALCLGFGVQIVGVVPFMVLAQLNLRHGRALPWAALIEALILWVMWRHLSGVGWPAATAAARRRFLRARAIDRRLLPATAITGLLFGLTIGCLVVFGNLWRPMPPEATAALTALAKAPPLVGLVTLLMVARSAGIVEEAAFRGYMQVPIEERHGPAVAIIIVALVFALSHAPPGPVLPLFTLGAVGWGLLARLTGSTLPGMVVHTLVDGSFLLWIWSDPERFTSLFASAPAAGTGSLVTMGGVTLLVALATGASFWWLSRVKRSCR